MGFLFGTNFTQRIGMKSTFFQNTSPFKLVLIVGLFLFGVVSAIDYWLPSNYVPTTISSLNISRNRSSSKSRSVISSYTLTSTIGTIQIYETTYDVLTTGDYVVVQQSKILRKPMALFHQNIPTEALPIIQFPFSLYPLIPIVLMTPFLLLLLKTDRLWAMTLEMFTIVLGLAFVLFTFI